MKKLIDRNIYINLLIILLLANLSSYAGLDFKKDLSQAEIKALAEGPLIKAHKTGKAWPDVILYQVIDVTALESVAIFYALDYQKHYIPNLKVSQVIKSLSPTLVHTRYVMDMPWPLSDTEYIHASELSYEQPSSYKVRWWMVESSSTEKVDGYAIFIPHGKQTLMKYFAHVEPKSFLASFVKSKMLKDVKSSLEATRSAIESIKSSNSELMKKYVTYIDQALQGKKVY